MQLVIQSLPVLTQATQTCLPLPEGLTWGEAIHIGQALSQAAEWMNWAIGDWLIYVETHFSATRYGAAEEIFKLSYQRLRNIKAVCRALPASLRRDTLSFTHHFAVCEVDLTQKERVKFLELAEKNEWSVENLREATRNKTEGKSEQIERVDADPAITAHTTRVTMWAAQENPDRYSRPVAEFWIRDLVAPMEKYCAAVRKRMRELEEGP